MQIGKPYEIVRAIPRPERYGYPRQPQPAPEPVVNPIKEPERVGV